MATEGRDAVDPERGRKTDPGPWGTGTGKMKTRGA